MHKYIDMYRWIILSISLNVLVALGNQMSKVKLLLETVGMWPCPHPLISFQLPVVFCGAAASDAIKACRCVFFFFFFHIHPSAKHHLQHPKSRLVLRRAPAGSPAFFFFFFFHAISANKRRRLLSSQG